MQSTSASGGDRPPGNHRFKIFDPDDEGAAPDPASPTIWRVIHARIEHLALRVQSGTSSKDAFVNIQKCLTRFGEAWVVAFDDGRVTLVPNAEPHRREPLKFSAATSSEAIEQARKISASITGEAIASAATARKNGDRLMSECLNDDLSRWMVANPQWESGHTKTNNLVAIVEAFSWFDDEHGFKSPYKRKRIPKVVKPSRREATDEEYVALMKHCCREVRRLLWCLYNLDGVRPCELREMLWSDFEWDGGFVLTFRHKTARATNKPRLFALTPRQLRFFQNLFKQKPEGNDHVFLNTDGATWTRRALAQNIRRTSERIGLDEGVAQRVSAYCFRHAWSTRVDEAGMPEQETAMLLGHKNTNMLREVYSKASQKVKYVRQAAEKAERLRREQRKRESGESGRFPMN